MNLQEILSYVTMVGSISGLLSGIYIIISKLREGPRVSLSIDSYRYGGEAPSFFIIESRIRNTGTRSTSIESFQLKLQSNGQMLSGSNPMLQDLAEVRRYERQYSPESRPMPERVPPLVIDAGKTVFLLAKFQLNGTIIGRISECTLTMMCTHKTLTKSLL